MTQIRYTQDIELKFGGKIPGNHSAIAAQRVHHEIHSTTHAPKLSAAGTSDYCAKLQPTAPGPNSEKVAAVQSWETGNQFEVPEPRRLPAPSQAAQLLQGLDITSGTLAMANRNAANGVDEVGGLSAPGSDDGNGVAYGAKEAEVVVGTVGPNVTHALKGAASVAGTVGYAVNDGIKGAAAIASTTVSGIKGAASVASSVRTTVKGATAVAGSIGTTVTDGIKGATVVAGNVGTTVTDGAKGAATMTGTVGMTIGGGIVGGVKDTMQDIKDQVKDTIVTRLRASAELVEAATPADRWYSLETRWPQNPSELPESMIPLGHKALKWKPPPEFMPLGTTQSSEIIGELRLEVLQCEKLPRTLNRVSVIDPYVLVVFEGAAARTSTFQNDRTPRWGADSPRAFKLPIVCPFSTVSIAVNDEDEGMPADTWVGRTDIDLSQLHGRTLYDAWFDLQTNTQRRPNGSRGSIRLRYSVEWKQDRLRLLGYLRPSVTFAVPFLTQKPLRNAAFAVKGKSKDPARFDSRTFAAHMRDLEKLYQRASRFFLDFFFWRWPKASMSAFAFWQLTISWPILTLAVVPFVLLVILVAKYLDLPARSPLVSQLTVSELLQVALVSKTMPGVTASGAATTERDKGDDDDTDDDDDEDLDDVDSRNNNRGEGDNVSSNFDEDSREGDDGNEVEVQELTPAGGGEQQDKVKRKREGLGRRIANRVGSMATSGVSSVRRVADPLAGVPSQLNFLIKSGRPTLAAELRRLQFECEEEVFSQRPPSRNDTGFTLNPLARMLGPVQYLLHLFLMYVRIAERVVSWEDRFLTFSACVVLVVIVALLASLGELIMLIPWASVFEWMFRLLGVAAFGPHMIWVGKKIRARMQEREKQAKLFAEADSATRNTILQEHRAAFLLSARERFDKVAKEKVAQDSDLLGEGGHSKAQFHMLVRSRPNAAGRHRCALDGTRSFAQCLYPAEDRPQLDETACGQWHGRAESSPMLDVALNA